MSLINREMYQCGRVSTLSRAADTELILIITHLNPTIHIKGVRKKWALFLKAHISGFN